MYVMPAFFVHRHYLSAKINYCKRFIVVCGHVVCSVALHCDA